MASLNVEIQVEFDEKTFTDELKDIKDDLEEKIIAQINKEGGVSNLTDKSTPDIISKLFGVSKKKYKMALGSLYKSKQIIIGDDDIRIKS